MAQEQLGVLIARALADPPACTGRLACSCSGVTLQPEGGIASAAWAADGSACTGLAVGSGFGCCPSGGGGRGILFGGWIRCLGTKDERLDYPSSVRPFTEDARDMKFGWELQIFARAARWYANLFCRAVVGFR